MNGHEKLGGKLQTGQVAPLTLGIYWFADSFSTLDSTPHVGHTPLKTLAEGLTGLWEARAKNLICFLIAFSPQRNAFTPYCKRERELRLGEFE